MTFIVEGGELYGFGNHWSFKFQEQPTKEEMWREKAGSQLMGIQGMEDESQPEVGLVENSKML
jgi:hypothetical protein